MGDVISIPTEAKDFEDLLNKAVNAKNAIMIWDDKDDQVTYHYPIGVENYIDRLLEIIGRIERKLMAESIINEINEQLEQEEYEE